MNNNMMLDEIEDLLRAHANWAHQAIHEQHLPVDEKTFIYGSGKLRGTVETKYAIQALITTSNHRAVEEFAAGLKDAMRHLPRHRPTNTSLWDGVQMNVALEAVDAHLASYKARQGVETQETVNTETHSNDSGDNREQRDCPTCAGKGYVGGYKSVTNSNNCPACHGIGKVKREETS